MCKLNGHSIFSYFSQPWNTTKLYTSKQREKETAAKRADLIEEAVKNSKGEEVSKSASTARLNSKVKNNRTLGSLRNPLESGVMGVNVGSDSTALGLNLGG